MQARWGTHGDYPIIVLAPASVREIYDETMRAFDLAERFRTPVVVLYDEAIGQLIETVELPEPSAASRAGRAQVGERTARDLPALRARRGRRAGDGAPRCRLPLPHHRPDPRRERLSDPEARRSSATRRRMLDQARPGTARRSNPTRPLPARTPRSWSWLSGSARARRGARSRSAREQRRQGRPVPPDHPVAVSRGGAARGRGERARGAGARDERRPAEPGGRARAAHDAGERAEPHRRRADRPGTRSRRASKSSRGHCNDARHLGGLRRPRVPAAGPDAALPVPRLRPRHRAARAALGAARAGIDKDRLAVVSGIGCAGRLSALHRRQHLPRHPRPAARLRHRAGAGAAGPAGGRDQRRRRLPRDRRQPPDPRLPPQPEDDLPDAQQRGLRHDRRPGLADHLARAASPPPPRSATPSPRSTPARSPRRPAPASSGGRSRSRCRSSRN